MNKKECEPGYFVFSLDTELAWGTLDWDLLCSQRTSRDGSKERETIRRLLDMMDEFGIVATWAITGHLFYDKCEECEVCPVLTLKGQDSSFGHIWKTRDPMWYGSDVVDMIISRGSGHEIAFHGYTHRLFNRLSRDEARFEIQEWLRMARRKNIAPHTVIFPQGRIGHLDLFQEAGFICYRGKDVKHPAFSIPLLGKVLNRINLVLSFLTPQVYEIQIEPQGLVNIPSSQWLFRTNRRIETLLDSLKLPYLRFKGTVKAIERAAEEKKIVHLWVHPHELRTEKDLQKLCYLFRRVADEVAKGRLQSITMADLAKQALKSAGRKESTLPKSPCEESG